MSALNVEVKIFCDISLPIYQQTWRQTPEHLNLLSMKILGGDSVIWQAVRVATFQKSNFRYRQNRERSTRIQAKTSVVFVAYIKCQLQRQFFYFCRYVKCFSYACFYIIRPHSFKDTSFIDKNRCRDET